MMARSKRRRVYPDWPSVHFDLLEKIFNCLNLVEKRCFASVCRSRIAKDEMKSLLKSFVPKSLLLLLPGGQAYMGKSGCCMLNLDDQVFSTVKMPLESHILGACLGGWLLLMTGKIYLILANLLFDIKIHLPSVLTFPCVKRDFKASENWITKAIIFGSDPLSSSDCGVVEIYGGGKLAFVKHGDPQWSDLGGAAENSGYYVDVTCFQESILALSNKAQVEVWNFSTSDPRKTIVITVPFPRDMAESKEPLSDRYKNQKYIVVSQDKELLVVRWIADFADPNGGVLTEDDLIQEDDPFLIAPYLTKKFYVHQLDSDAKRWVGVESLGNQVLFLGGNQSLSLHAEDYAGCEKNSIYFTDDYWDRIDEHECYGGHDMGIFRLEDGSIDQEICGSEAEKILPPFWLLSLCNSCSVS